MGNLVEYCLDGKKLYQQFRKGGRQYGDFDKLVKCLKREFRKEELIICEEESIEEIPCRFFVKEETEKKFLECLVKVNNSFKDIYYLSGKRDCSAKRICERDSCMMK